MLLPTAALDYPRIKLLTVGDVGVGKSCFIKRYCEGRFVAKYIPTIGIDYGVKKMEVKAARYAESKEQRKAQQKGGNTTTAAASHAVPPTAVRVNFWDAAGGPESLEVRNEFYGATQGIFLMYDVRNAESFASLERWWDELRAYIALSDEPAGAREPAGPMGVTRRTSTTAQTPAGKAVGDTNGRAPIVVLCANKVDEVGEGKRVVSEAEGRQWAKSHGCAAYFETSASTGQNVAEAIEHLFYDVLGKFM